MTDRATCPDRQTCLNAILRRVEAGETTADDAAVLRRVLAQANRTIGMLNDQLGDALAEIRRFHPIH